MDNGAAREKSRAFSGALCHQASHWRCYQPEPPPPPPPDHFFEATGSEMCVGQADIRQIYQGIEGAEAERAVGLLDRDPISRE